MSSSAEEEVGAAKRKNRARVAREPQKTRKWGWDGAEDISVSLCSLVEISVLIFNTNLAALVTNEHEWTRIGWASRGWGGAVKQGTVRDLTLLIRDAKMRVVIQLTKLFISFRVFRVFSGLVSTTLAIL